jgi:hypothetical protein
VVSQDIKAHRNRIYELPKIIILFGGQNKIIETQSSDLYPECEYSMDLK